jgi:hypothetical protein
MTTDENVDVKTTKQVERAVINDVLKNKLVQLTDQANVALQGIATLTKSDIVNLILSAHADELSSAEIDQLKALHLDQVKYAFWVAKKLKEARAAGETLSLQDILATSGSLMAEVQARVPRRPRKKKEQMDPLAGFVTVTAKE